MTHELKLIFDTLKIWQQAVKKVVFVTVVDLDGSSYRRPGVQMLISEEDELVGLVSGGCVEGEIVRQSKSVFRTGRPKIMTYDGRLRIGCEGILYIMIEPVFISEELFHRFETTLANRGKIPMKVYYYKKVDEYPNIGTLVTLDGKTYPLNPSFSGELVSDQLCFAQTLDPVFRLFIIGAEHDAVLLCQSAKLLGWEVTIVASTEEEKSCEYFPGADAMITPMYEQIDTSLFDNQTAVVLMTHSYNKDVQYLMALRNCFPAYLGLVGSVKRRERVIEMLMEHCPDTTLEFLDQIHGPAGLNIGAETPSEIAVSILAEILSVIRKQQPGSLRDKKGSIHG